MQTVVEIWDQLIEGIRQTTPLEFIAVIFGIISVWMSKKNNILVFPSGMINTGIFVYILIRASLLGDMMINAYYFIMSIYGWYIWTRKVDPSHFTPISRTTKKEKGYSVLIFIFTLLFVYIVYTVFDKWTDWTAYVDTLTTAIFFVGMWLMSKRKIENWVYWIVGDVITIPLYFYKGLVFTSLQYLVFTVLAVLGYSEWKKRIKAG